MKQLVRYLLVIFLVSSSCYAIHAQERDTTMWVTNGTVKAIGRYENTLYLGGNFTYVGPNTGGGATLNRSNGKVSNTPFLQIHGQIYAATPDGKGGWFIGGTFTLVQGVERSNLAHILANGMVDKTWNPIADAVVYTIAVSGNTVYVGGSFTNIGGGASRNRLAAIDATTGQVTSWNPNLNAGVKSLVVVGNTVYVGGNFSYIGGLGVQYRVRLAAIDATTGKATDWNPNADGLVNTLTVSDNILYVGGSFSTIGGVSRSKVAAIDITNGQVTAWNPNANGSVNTLTVSGSTMYVGGNFTSIGGQNRNYVAAIDTITGQSTNWNPNANSSVTTLALTDNHVYVGGNFSAIGGASRNKVAAINATTGQATSWNPNADGGAVNTLSVSGSNVYVGGDFTSIGGQVRNRLAAIDATTGQATAWNPNADGVVNALVVFGNTVYAGGNFGIVDGQYRINLAAINATTGLLTPWKVSTNSEVKTMAVANNTVYIGGDFYNVNFAAGRNKLASVDATTGKLTPWNPNVEGGSVNVLAVYGNTAYVGGHFTSVGGKYRNKLAAVDATTGKLTSWNPFEGNASGSIYALAVSGNGKIVYVEHASKLLAIDAAIGKATAWNSQVSGSFNLIFVSGNVLYVGGNITSIDGQNVSGFAEIDAVTGKATAWNPRYIYKALAVTTIGKTVYIGGSFTYILNRYTPYFTSIGKYIAPTNLIEGTVHEDLNGDCVQNAEEKGIANTVIMAQPGNYYTSTDSLGHYSLLVDTGSFTVAQAISSTKNSFIRQTCPVSSPVRTVNFSGSNDTLSRQDFANQITLLPYLNVSVSSTRRRRCFTSMTTISYCNSGKASADGVKVYLKLPQYVELVSASMPYTVDKDHNYVFAIGNVGADRCGSIQLVDSVACGNTSIRGLTQCTKVWITPANVVAPTAAWDQSDVHLKAACVNNGTVRLGIYNTSAGYMADSSTYRIFLDAELAFSARYKLAKGDSLILNVPANGKTIRLEADQRLNHPTRQQSNITIEACGKGSSGTVSKGFVNQFPQDDVEPEVAIECLPIIDSFDPNDKSVSPIGVTAEKYTPTGKALDYVIRFQNTGTDVAYKVIIVDTLSADLDIRTLQLGAASHPYTMHVSGKGKPVLTFTFSNILLPDSTTNKAGSNGFIQFAIQPKANLAEKTRIENFADIYFDYNEPVRTNTTRNTIYDIPLVVAEAVRLSESIICTNTNTTVNAGSNQVICQSDSAQLNAVMPQQGTGHWRLRRGNGIIDALEDPQSIVRGLSYGDNVFEWSVPINRCGSDSLRASVTITRIANPGTPIIRQKGADSLQCNLIGSRYEWMMDGNILRDSLQTIRVTSSGSYSVRVKTEHGCSSEWSAVYTYKLPCETINTTIHAGTDRRICEQDTIRLAAAAPQTGQGRWTLISGTAVITQPENAASLVTGLSYGDNVFEWRIPASSCGDDSLTARITITRSVKPTVPIVTQVSTDSLMASVSGSSYKWFLDGNTLNQHTQAITVAQAGTYTVQVTSREGCKSDESAPFAYVVTSTEPAVIALIRVYPNPTSGVVSVELPATVSQNTQISVWNMLGNPLLNQTIQVSGSGVQQTVIDLSGQASGMYLIKLQTHKGTIVHRVFKK